VSDKTEWFAPRRYGFGAGLPISWQGWAVSLVYAGAMVGAAIVLHRQPLQLVAVLIPVTAVFLVVSARTTRGGWRWRWGDED
jgi:hypothetical protein